MLRGPLAALPEGAGAGRGRASWYPSRPMANRSLRARARSLAQRAIEALLRTPTATAVRSTPSSPRTSPAEDHGDAVALPWGQAAHAHLQRYRARLEVGPPEAFDDAEVIRRRRVALRRLRTVLLLAGDADAMAEADKPLRRLARELGAVRDADVALAAVREHGRAAVGTLEQAALDELEAKLARRRRRARDRAATRGTETALAHALAGVERASAAWRDDEGHARASASAWLAVHRQALDAALQQSLADHELEPLHAVRKLARRLRYAVALLRPLALPQAPSAAALSRLQAALGQHRDAALLHERVRERIDRALARQRFALARGLEPTLAALRARRSHAWIELDAALQRARVELAAPVGDDDPQPERG